MQVFSLLDVLKGWVSEARAAATPSFSGDSPVVAQALLSFAPKLSQSSLVTTQTLGMAADLTSTSSKSGRRRGSAGVAQDADSPAARVGRLLDGIDMELLARAASQCGAHARALLYFESHVRAKARGTLNPTALASTTFEDDDVSFFQACLISALLSGLFFFIPLSK